MRDKAPVPEPVVVRLDEQTGANTPRHTGTLWLWAQGLPMRPSHHSHPTMALTLARDTLNTCQHRDSISLSGMHMHAREYMPVCVRVSMGMCAVVQGRCWASWAGACSLFPTC